MCALLLKAELKKPFSIYILIIFSDDCGICCSCPYALMITGTPESFSLDRFGSSVQKLQSEAAVHLMASEAGAKPQPQTALNQSEPSN